MNELAKRRAALSSFPARMVARVGAITGHKPKERMRKTPQELPVSALIYPYIYLPDILYIYIYMILDILIYLPDILLEAIRVRYLVLFTATNRRLMGRTGSE